MSHQKQESPPSIFLLLLFIIFISSVCGIFFPHVFKTEPYQPKVDQVNPLVPVDSSSIK